jgi:hypothetical protein
MYETVGATKASKNGSLHLIRTPALHAVVAAAKPTVGRVPVLLRTSPSSRHLRRRDHLPAHLCSTRHPHAVHYYS